MAIIHAQERGISRLEGGEHEATISLILNTSQRVVMLMREATPADARLVIESVAAGLVTYREWAPPDWSPPSRRPGQLERLSARLAEADVWCLLALDGEQLAGHVSLSPVTAEDPEPAPTGMTNLWQMFVGRPWQGRGVATALMAEAVAEAGRRGYERLRLWTPEGAAQARRFYEREGWVHTGALRQESMVGLPLVEYQREVPSKGSGRPMW